MTIKDLHICRDFRYLDCETCRENELECIEVCTYCGEEKIQ